MPVADRYLLLGLAILLVAVLTAGGMAIRSVSRLWLRHWAERQLRGAPAALAFLERPHRLLTASSAAVSLVVVLTGVLLGGWERDPLWRFLLVVVAVVLLLVLVGQILARALARRWASALVPVTLPILQAFELLAWPVLALGRAAARPFEAPASGGRAAPERDSLHDLLREGELEGVGEREEIAIITGVVEFGDKHVREVMTPRERVYALDEATPPRELALALAQAGYGRVPIYRGTLDGIVGMVHAFDVLKSGADAPLPLRPAAVTDPDVRCNDLLFRMLRGRFHLAVVRDGDGRVAGIVTLEDLLEELVGDIRDEHDEQDEHDVRLTTASSPAT